MTQSTMRKANGDDSPRPGKRPRLSDEAPDEESANVAQSDSLSDGWFGSEIDFDDATLQAVDDYDVFQPGLDSNNPFLDDDQEVPSSQGEADGTKYAIGKAHVNYSSQSDGRDVSPTLETKRINFNLSPVPAFSKEAELVPHITSLDEDIPDKDADIDFGAYVDIPDAVGFTSAEAILSDVSLPTFMPASQVPIDRESLTFPKSVPRLNIKLAGGGGAIKPITTEDIKASASKLMAYQQDTKWKPQFRSRTMLPPVAPVQPPVVEDADTNSRPLEDIDFGAFVKPNLGFTTASADYDADEIPTFMPASQVPIDRSDLASTSSIKPIKKSNVKLAGGLGGLKPLTEDEIKASAEKLMAYQQDTTWKPKARTRLPRLAATADDPKLDPDDSGVGLLEPVKDPEQSTLPIDTGKGKQRDMVPHADEPNEQISEDQTIKPTPLRVSGNPFSSRPQLGTPVRSTPLFSTPVRPIPAPQFSAQTPSDLSAQTPLFSQAAPMSQTAPSTLYRLGLSQRKPKNKGTGFTTPFKPGMAPGEKGRDVLRGTPVKSDVTSTPFRGATPLRNGVSGITRALEAEKEKRILERAVFDTRFKSERKTLRQAGFIPLAAVSRDHPSTIPCLSLKASASFSFPQGGHAEMLKALQDQGCTLADEDWAKNHWAQVIWKLSGLARSGAPDAKEKWKWEEAMRQMLYRYEREINRAERPAIRRIQEHDASPSQPIVLCVSNVQIENGGEVGIELTDGWYRIRATTDKVLTRAAKKGKLAAGRKIAVAGARLEGGHEGKEVLKAYHSSALKITANSTSLARWDTRLGFHRGPFVSSLRSLSADGGSVTLLDIIVTKLFPVGFVETDEKGRSGRPFDQSAEDDAQRAWEERRSNEASKWRLELEKRLERMRSAAGRLRHSARGASFNAEDIPEDAETFLEEFEEGEYDLETLKGHKFGPTSAAWLADAIQTKSDEFYERREEEMERRLANICPPRKTRNFRVVVIKDARPLRKPTERTAQLTAWDVLAFGADSLHVGQRYLLSNVQPSQPGSWRKNDFGGDIYLSTRRDTKWTAISDA